VLSPAASYTMPMFAGTADTSGYVVAAAAGRRLLDASEVGQCRLTLG